MSVLDSLRENISSMFSRSSGAEITEEKEFVAKSEGADAPPMSQRLDILNLPEPPNKKQKEYLQAMRGWVYRAVMSIAQEVAKVDLVLYRSKANGEPEVIDNHIALDVLNRVNGFQTRFDFLEGTAAFLELVGEAFWYKDKVGKTPRQLWILRPDWVEVLPPKKKGEYIGGYRYKIPGSSEVLTYRVDQIIQFKYFNPLNPYRGMGPLQAADYAYDTDFFASKWNRNFFYNSAMPDTILTTDQSLKKEEIERIKEEWHNKFGGTNNAHKMAVLTGGLKIDTVIKQTIREMEFTELRRFSRDEIFTIFQVPKSIVGITEDVNLANAREGKIVFLENVIKPKMEKLVQFLNEFYLPDFGDDLYFGYRDPAPENMDLNLRIAEAGKSFLTVNERRDIFGYEPVDGGDIIYVPFSDVPMGSDQVQDDQSGQDNNQGNNNQDNNQDNNGEGDDSKDNSGKGKRMTAYKEIKVERKSKKDRVIVRHKGSKDQELRNEIRHGLEEVGIDKDLQKMVYSMVSKRAEKGLPTKIELSEEKKEAKKKDDQETAYRTISEEAGENFWKLMVSRSVKQEGGFSRILKRFFKNQKEEVLRKLESQKGLEEKSADKYLFDIESQSKVLVQLLMPLLKEIISQAGKDALRLLSLSDEFKYTEEVHNLIERYGLLVSKSVNLTIHDLLRKAIQDGLANQEGISEIAKRIKGVYSEADNVRAKMIARTETIRSNNLGHVEGYKQSGMVDFKEWKVALDERTCEYCLKMEKEYRVRSLSENFLSKGDLLLGLDGGEMKIDYSDIAAPPLHPNCRCVVLPVVKLR